VEDNFEDNLGGLFDEAYNNTSTDLTDSIKDKEEVYSDFTLYSEGGLKLIELCYNRKTNRKVAMATLKEKDDPFKVEVFLREAKLNAALQHPNIVPVYNIGLNEKGPWFTMKFIAGKSLQEIIAGLSQGAESEFSELSSRLDIFLKVCDAIAYSHSLGVIHLDIKPDNIRISKYGDVVVCDWGLADVEASCCDELLLEYCSVLDHDIQNHTLLGTVKGSPGYMAPEQTAKIKMRKGFHTDIFSLGTLLYALLTYEKPFKADTLDKILDITAKCDFPKPSAIDPEVPSSLEAVCLKAMSRSPEERYKSIENLKKDILAYRNGFATNAENASLLKFLKLLYLRHRTVSIVSILALSLLVLLAILSVNHLNLTKRNALQLAEKMSLEAEYHRKVNKDVAPLFFERAQIAFKTHYLDDALNFVTSAVELDDTMKDAWLLKGKLHFINGDFSETQYAIKKSGSEHHIIRLSERFRKEQKPGQQLSTKVYLEILQILNKEKDFDIYGKMVHKIVYSKISLEKRISFCKEVIEMRHQNKKRKDPLNFKFNQDTGHLDISNNSWLTYVLCLQNFPAISVNASNTGLYNPIGFKSQQLTSLDISSTNIVALQTLENKNLKYLNIANCAVPNLTPIYDLPLETIDIRNTGLRSLNFTTVFKSLREIHINKGQFNDRHISIVPTHVKLIYHTPRQKKR
jgi:serine/threonine protein kinase